MPSLLCTNLHFWSIIFFQVLFHPLLVSVKVRHIFDVAHFTAKMTCYALFNSYSSTYVTLGQECISSYVLLTGHRTGRTKESNHNRTLFLCVMKAIILYIGTSSNCCCY